MGWPSVWSPTTLPSAIAWVVEAWNQRSMKPTSKNVAGAWSLWRVLSTCGVYGPGPSSKVRATSRFRPPPLVTKGVYESTWSMARSSIASRCRAALTAMWIRCLSVARGLGGVRRLVPDPPSTMIETTSTSRPSAASAVARRRWICRRRCAEGERGESDCMNGLRAGMGESVRLLRLRAI